MWLTLAVAAVAVVLGAGCASAPASSLPPQPRPPGTVTVAAAGDIASCDENGDAATASVVRALRPDAVLTLGDNVYPDGSQDQFSRCYAPTWGTFRAKTYPAPGNHDYATPEAAGYFAYFGRRAPGPYYSFELGAWHLVSLNSEIARERGSRQERWLRRDLARDRHTCELLYWHRPRWSGGAHGSDKSMQALWQAAYDHGVELVLTGHDHNYQRFYRLDARGRRDVRRGVVHLVVGTGGKSHYATRRMANRAAANTTTFGVLALSLRPGAYDLRFVPVRGSTWTDSLTGRRCRGAPRRG